MTEREDPPPEATQTQEAYDADGLPLHRKPTLDDVRGSGSGATIAVGCTVAVVLAVVAFWVVYCQVQE